MRVEFTKMHGAGNDFVMVNGMARGLDLTSEQVARICDRHFGVGADGVIVVERSPLAEADGYMHYYNSDGTLAQMCGNGTRCTAKFLVDNGYVDPRATSLVVDTLSGPKSITFETDDEGLLAQATVDMGTPTLDPPAVPTNMPANANPFGLGPAVVDAALDDGTNQWKVTCVSMGNPHAVIFVDDPDSFDVTGHGPVLENLTSAFPEKANIEFASVAPDAQSIRMRVWERGCGETLACGTGACATLVAAALTGRTGRQATIRLTGGDLRIRWDDETGHVLMTGPAKTSFRGAFELA